MSKYDFAGRVTYNSAGPLVQQLEYDAFSNLTERQNNFWGFMDRFQAWYTNNRKVSSTSPVYDTFDGSGNVVESLFDPYTPNGDRDYKDSKWWTFDAAGRVTYFSQYTTYTPSDNARETKQDTTFDGDGRAVIDYERWRPCGTADDPDECEGTWSGMPFHYLVSSVTGQRITVLYDGENGGQTVHMGGTKIASYFPPLGEAPEYRSFTISDPVTGSKALIEADGTAHLSDRTELAALGTSVPLFEPPAFPGWENLESGFVGDAEHGCRDSFGDPEPCSLSRVRAHAAGVEDRKRKRKAKEPISVVVPRNLPKMPFASPERGPSAGLAARLSFDNGSRGCPEGQEARKDPTTNEMICVDIIRADVEIKDHHASSNFEIDWSSFEASNGYGSWIDHGRLKYIENRTFASMNLQGANIGLNACGTVASGYEYSNVLNGHWKGPNSSIWYEGMSGRGPNGVSGARSVAVLRSNFASGLGKGLFYLGTAVAGAQVYNDAISLEKGALDITVGYIGVRGGPWGAAGAAAYFVVDNREMFETPPQSKGPRAVSTNVCHDPGRNRR